MKLTIRDVPEKHWHDAVQIAIRFNQDFPDRSGVYHGVGHRLINPDDGSVDQFYTYRTKSGTIVVRGEEEAPNDQQTD